MFCGDDARHVHHEQYCTRTLTGQTLEFLHSVCSRCHYKIEFKRTGQKRPQCSAKASTVKRRAAAARLEDEHHDLDQQWLDAIAE